MPVEPKEWNLDPETEYRFELDPGTSLAVKVRLHTFHFYIGMTLTEQLIRGHAEVFGAELAANKPYLFGSECKAAIFTWRGCTIEMSPPDSIPRAIRLTVLRNTSQASRRPNMFQKRHRWRPTQICTLLLSKCEYAH
jgi:hypothetical protein